MVLSLRVLVLLLFLILQVPCHAQEEEQIVFGEKVSSPFSWMDKLASPRVQKWLELQETNQEDYFKRSDFKKLNSILYTPKRQEFKETTRYRFEMITGAKTPPKLKVKENIADPEIRTLIRCNDFKLSKHDFPSIEEYWVADSELFLVAAVSHSGSDWLELLVYDLEKMNLIDTLKGVVNPGIIFHGKGFYYERYDEPDDLKSIRFNQRISFHEFNSSQKDDRNVFVNNDPSSIRSFGYTQLDDTRFIYVFHPIKIKDAWKEAITKIELGNFSPLRPFFIYSSPHRITFEPVWHQGDTVLMRTDLRDPHFEVLKFNTTQLNKYESFIPPNDLVLKKVTYLNEAYFGLKYLSDGRYLGVIVNEQGEWKKQISTNEGSSITFQKNSEEEAYCFHQHFLLKYNVEFINLKDLTTRYITRSSGSGFIIDEKIIVTTYKSDDLDIPLTIIYNKEKFVKNANQPAMIKVYGGYGSIQEPSFDWENYLFVKNGGLLAFPGVRGSGAKGADWGLAGRGLNKQKTIDDVIAAAEYLVRKRYVKKSGLFLQGGSHGGFVVSAAAVQRPDLFRGVIVNAGVFDLLISGQQSVGYAQLNREEYGDPTDSLGFINRLNLSPIHNLKSGIKYPSFLIITGSNDTRVPPSQSYRFMAALKQHSANEVNFLHVTGGGHNIIQFPKEDQEIISLKFKFLWLHTGIKFWKG